MNFPSIDIQGSIISFDLQGKIRSEQASFQQGKDFILFLVLINFLRSNCVIIHCQTI